MVQAAGQRFSRSNLLRAGDGHAASDRYYPAAPAGYASQAPELMVDGRSSLCSLTRL